MDWNWFFSSLAQSTAAIVGIFGAFIITKTLSNQTSFDSKRKLIRELASRSENLRDEANDLEIDWYNRKIAKWQLEKISELLDGNENLSTEELYKALNFSIYQPKNDSLRLIAYTVELRARKKEAEAEAARERMRKSGNWFDVRHKEFEMPNLTSHFDTASVTQERERIDAVVRNCKQHIRVVKDAISAVSNNPEHSPQITYTLLLVLILFYSGVIYPLSFTPANVGAPPAISLLAFIDVALSLKGLLLSLVSVAFTVVIGMFFVMNIRMKYGKDDLAQLKSFASLGFYSESFETAAEQQRIHEEDDKADAEQQKKDGEDDED